MGFKDCANTVDFNSRKNLIVLYHKWIVLLLQYFSVDCRSAIVGKCMYSCGKKLFNTLAGWHFNIRGWVPNYTYIGVFNLSYQFFNFPKTEECMAVSWVLCANFTSFLKLKFKRSTISTTFTGEKNVKLLAWKQWLEGIDMWFSLKL